MPESVPCFVEPCENPGLVKVVRLDAPADVAEMLLCQHHYWDWNARSLARRGFRHAARQLQGLVDQGFLDDVQEVTDRAV